MSWKFRRSPWHFLSQADKNIRSVACLIWFKKAFSREKFEKNKKIEIFKKKYLHFRKRWCILNKSTAKSKRQTNKWPVGQGVKTSPSHGENTGSIPVLAAKK